MRSCAVFCAHAGYMNSLAEKFWNTKINVWMRGPGCVVGAFIAYQSALESSLAACTGDQCAALGERVPSGQKAAALTTAVILLWNGQVRGSRQLPSRSRRAPAKRIVHALWAAILLRLSSAPLSVPHHALNTVLRRARHRQLRREKQADDCGDVRRSRRRYATAQPIQRLTQNLGTYALTRVTSAAGEHVSRDFQLERSLACLCTHV